MTGKKRVALIAGICVVVVVAVVFIVMQRGPGLRPLAEGVYINPVSQEAEPGQTITANVEVNPVDWGVSGAEISLEFDPAALEATSVELGDFLGDAPLVAVNKIDNDAGTLRLALARVGETEVASPPGVLAIVTFKVQGTAASASYELALTNVVLIDQNFEEIAGIKFEGASINIIL